MFRSCVSRADKVFSPSFTALSLSHSSIHTEQQYKVEVYQQQIDMEKLCHQGELLLKKVSDQTDRDMIQEPLTELRHLWDNLGDKITQRQVRNHLMRLKSWITHNWVTHWDKTVSGSHLLCSWPPAPTVFHCFPWESRMLVFVGISKYSSSYF